MGTRMMNTETTYNPLISIIIASYNYGRYLEKNLNSIVNQTYNNIEIIVIDDGSTDNSVEIIKKFADADNRIKFLQHPNNANLGLSFSVKYALEQAQGEYVAFCESDDYWATNHLEEKVQIIRLFNDAEVIVNKPSIFGPDKECVDRYNKGFFTLYKLLKSLKKPTNIFFPMLKTFTFPTFSVVMVKREKLNVCDFNSIEVSGLDIWLWSQLTLTCKTAYCPIENLTYWRRSGESLIVGSLTSQEYFYALNKMLPLTKHQRVKMNVCKFVNKIIKRFIYVDKIKGDYHIKRWFFAYIPAKKSIQACKRNYK